jgi:hypothetical protein
MGYKVLILFCGFLIAIFSIEWKDWRNHISKNITLIVLLILALVFGLFDSNEQNKKDLDTSNSNKNLLSQNKELLSKIDKYQNDLEVKNEKIIDLQNQVTNIKDYSYYALMNAYGQDITPGYGISYSSDLSDKMKKILYEFKGATYVKNDMSILPLIDEVINEYPRFPFGYCAKFNLLSSHNDKTWKIYAVKALEIFKITTTLEGHSPAHDEAKKALLEILAGNS